jgi:hypothetical protein
VSGLISIAIKQSLNMAEKKGKLAEIKTKATTANVEDFIAKVQSEQKREDSLALLKLLEKVSNEKPKLWGASLIGFGDKRYKSPASGREVDWFKVGFAPRKANISLYLMLDHKKHEAALGKLGKYKTDGGCIYINKLSDINIKVLEGLIKESIKNK